ncbi:hypothetical protein [Bradyrhizobium manausense]|uniref:hypothetical protein n=1 Tax=Bradyrhizobium manausense TaxID=989370 RepID=UPI00201274EE|nr:hypothetical protein [Bradyrhizobium manausense]
MPTPKQMEKLAFSAGRQTRPAESSEAPGELAPEYWEAILNDPRVAAEASGGAVQMKRLSEIKQYVLRVSCRRCDRIVEMQKADAVRMYGSKALWKDVGQRLLDNTCQQRTGRHEEDGCWPVYDRP